MHENFITMLRKVRGTNATDTSFPALAITATEPVGANVVEVSRGGLGQSQAILFPYGTGDDDGVLTGMRIVLWRPMGFGTQRLWLPQLACLPFAGVMSTAVGVANGLVVATERFLDTITNADTTITAVSEHIQLVSPGNNVPAHISLDLKGAWKLQVDFDLGANMTGANALLAFY